MTEKQAKKNVRCENEHDEAFKELKQSLCSASIIACLNFKVSAPPFVPDTGTSDVAAGGVI